MEHNEDILSCDQCDYWICGKQSVLRWSRQDLFCHREEKHGICEVVHGVDGSISGENNDDNDD